MAFIARTNVVNRCEQMWNYFADSALLDEKKIVVFVYILYYFIRKDKSLAMLSLTPS